MSLEAYQFEGVMQKFPNHFHEHYVIGFVESGRRHLICKNKEYVVNAGDLLLFNPLDSHTCAQVDDKALDWRCLNIEKDVMLRVAQEIMGVRQYPIFTASVVPSCNLVAALRSLHYSIINKTPGLDKEESFYFFMGQLLADYAQQTKEPLLQVGKEVLLVCNFIEENYMKAIKLADLSEIFGFNKYVLLRSFTLQKGITPYQYLSTIRVNNAKKMLEDGMPLIDVAGKCGFTDQSHFTRFFKNFIGVTPKVYQNLFM